jgi:hypothetical protein
MWLLYVSLVSTLPPPSACRLYLWPAFSKLHDMTIAKYVNKFLTWSAAQHVQRSAREHELLQSYSENCMKVLKSIVPPAVITEIQSKGLSLEDFVSSPDDVIAMKLGSQHWSCKACAFNKNKVGSDVCETCRSQDAGWTCGGCLSAQNLVGTMRCKACKLPNTKALCGESAALLESEEM